MEYSQLTIDDQNNADTKHTAQIANTPMSLDDTAVLSSVSSKFMTTVSFVFSIKNIKN